MKRQGKRLQNFFRGLSRTEIDQIDFADFHADIPFYFHFTEHQVNPQANSLFSP